MPVHVGSRVRSPELPTGLGGRGSLSSLGQLCKQLFLHLCIVLDSIYCQRESRMKKGDSTCLARVDDTCGPHPEPT